MSETRYTDPLTGGQKGQKDARFGGADPLFLQELAKVYGMGEGKYERYNYLKGYPWSLSVDALFRHLFAFLAGEDRDPESGLLHTAHVAWHAGALTSFQLRRAGTDDRAPVENGPVEPSCCDYACYEDPGCRCDNCVEYASQPHTPCECDLCISTETAYDWKSRISTERCDHGVSLEQDCYDCPEAGRYVQ